MRLRDEDVDEREGNALEDGEVGDWEGNHRPRKRHYDEMKIAPILVLSLTVKRREEPSDERE